MFTCIFFSVKKNFTACFTSRSEQMPPVAKEVAPHPKSLNHITLSRMLKQSKERKLTSFLCKELNGITTATASKISTAVGDNSVDLSSSKVTALCQSLRDDKSIKPPTAHCLSPAGEYNMRLGVLKVSYLLSLFSFLFAFFFKYNFFYSLRYYYYYYYYYN